MAVIRTITSANLIYMISVAGLFSAPVRLEGYSVDDAFSSGEVNHAELQLGVDAQVGAGYIPALIPQKFMFLASSPSIDIFETWGRTNSQQLETLTAQGTAFFPATGKSYTCIDGFLTGYSPMPDAKKVLGPRPFTVTWSDIQPAPYAPAPLTLSLSV